MKRALPCSLLMLASVPACDPPSAEDKAPPMAAQRSAAPKAAGCADSLVADLDRQSFSGPDGGAGEAELDRWTRDGAAAFKTAAGRLCAAGKLPPAELAPFKRLLIQYGGGADSAAIWVDEARPDAIILQYAFSRGSPAPSAGEVGEALSCWNDPDMPICQERLP